MSKKKEKKEKYTLVRAVHPSVSLAFPCCLSLTLFCVFPNLHFHTLFCVFPNLHFHQSSIESQRHRTCECKCEENYTLKIHRNISRELESKQMSHLQILLKKSHLRPGWLGKDWRKVLLLKKMAVGAKFLLISAKSRLGKDSSLSMSVAHPSAEFYTFPFRFPTTVRERHSGNWLAWVLTMTPSQEICQLEFLANNSKMLPCANTAVLPKGWRARYQDTLFSSGHKGQCRERHVDFAHKRWKRE